MFTIAPPRSRMCAAAAWAQKNGARRLTANIASHCSTVTSRTGVRTITAAEFTSTSSAPRCSTTAATRAPGASGRVRSDRNASAVPPASRTSRQVASACSGSER